MSTIVETISHAIQSMADENPEGRAFVSESGRYISFSSLCAQITQVTATLREAGIRATDRVAFASPRNYFGISGFVGIASAGICCPVNPRLSESEFADLFRALSISCLVAEASSTEAIAAATRLGMTVVAAGSHDNLALTVSAGRVARDRATESDQPRYALLMQTSGTTSQPKIVLLTHANILAAARGIVREFSLDRHDLCLNPMPLHHVHGLVSAGISSLLSGSSSICLPNFTPRSFASVYDKQQPTWFTGSPAMHIALLEHYRRASITPTNKRLRFLRSSSAPLPAAIISDLESLFGAPLIETYGLTETASMITTNPLPPGVRKVGSVGKANIGELRIVSDDGEDAPPNSEGEIVVRGPSVIEQYAGRTSAHSASFIDGWLRTGDLGRLDEEGYCFVTGRKKELIKRGGLSVYPNEIDNILADDPRVSEAVAFSIPHPTLGEELIAAVVSAGGVSLAGDELRESMLAKLPAYKVPAKILVIDEIPRSETGKILRRTMAEKLSHLLEPQNKSARGACEEKLLSVWRDILARTDIGVTDNVFVFGADPTRARVAEELLKEIGLPTLSASDMFRAPTVSQQATIIESKLSWSS